MLEIIKWLRQVEYLAHKVYLRLTDSSMASASLRALLKRLAEDEALHYDLLGNAAELIRKEAPSHVPIIIVDDEMKANIETPLLKLQDNNKTNQMTEHDILETIVQAETSEWNDIFLYVINTCQNISPTFKYIAATIQAHEKRVEDYIQALPGEKRLGLEIQSLSKIWHDKILVVEDDRA